VRINNFLPIGKAFFPEAEGFGISRPPKNYPAGLSWINSFLGGVWGPGLYFMGTLAGVFQEFLFGNLAINYLRGFNSPLGPANFGLGGVLVPPFSLSNGYLRRGPLL